MANPFRDMSVIMQALVAAAVAVVLVLVGVYVPGSPIARERDEVDRAVQQRTKLNQEVQQLSVYKQRYGELKQQMDALSKQLDTLKTIVPEEKEVDEFIRLLQGAASASNVQLRRLSRIINVGDLTFDDPDRAKGSKYPLRPGTTVTGIFTATTFFTKPADAVVAPAAGAKAPAPAAPAGKR